MCLPARRLAWGLALLLHCCLITGPNAVLAVFPVEQDAAALADIVSAGNARSLFLSGRTLIQVQPDCSWAGVICECTEGSSISINSCARGSVRVTGLTTVPFKHVQTSRNTQTWSLPSSFGNLTALTYLKLSSARLSGTLPQSFSLLTNLEQLDLTHNQLQGPLPTWLGHLPRLRSANLSFNQFSGTTPSTWCSSAGTTEHPLSRVFSNGVAFDLQGNPQLTDAAPCQVRPSAASFLAAQRALLQAAAATPPSPPPFSSSNGNTAASSSHSSSIYQTTLAWSLPVAAAVFAALGAVISLWVLKHRQERQQQVERERQQEHKMLKQLMYALTDMTPPPGYGYAGGMAAGSLFPPALTTAVPNTLGGMDRQLSMFPSAMQPINTRDAAAGSQVSPWGPGIKSTAFVVTDIEGSTELSAAAGQALFAKLQEIHDNIMREFISRHNGLEVVTEGDSFTVAFMSVALAVAFCMEVQYKLNETAWPPACLKLPSCKPVTGAGGKVAMQGLRVRMGVHLAEEGSVVRRIHQVTKQPVFQGPGLATAQEVGDAAHGGQVLLSHDAWVSLRTNMAQAGFPVVRCLGLFQLPSLPAQPTWLYHVTKVVGKPLGRVFPPPRKPAQKVWAPQTSGGSISSSGGHNNIMGSPSTDLTPPPPPPARPRHLSTMFASFTVGSSSMAHRHTSLAPQQQVVDPCWDLQCMPPPGLGLVPNTAVATGGLTFVVARLEIPPRRMGRKTPLPQGLAARLHEVLCMQAQQFRGYIFYTPYTAAAMIPPSPPHSRNLFQQATSPSQLVGAAGTNRQSTAMSHQTSTPSPLANQAVTPTLAAVSSNGTGLVNVSVHAPSLNTAAGAPAMAMHNMLFNSNMSTTGSTSGIFGTSGKPYGSGSRPWCVWRVAFESAVDALRFCHSSQVALMYTRCWYDSSFASWIGEQVYGPEGRPQFQGPRIAMALHTSSDYTALVMNSPSPSPEPVTEYAGSGVEQCALLAAAVNGGQVVLTELAWDHVKQAMVAHPGAVVALHLGSHVISPAWPEPQALMEVMPNLLARRTFPALATYMQTQPGYRDAPPIDKPLAIVFVKVQKPSAVIHAQQGGSGSGGPGSSGRALLKTMPDHQILSAIMAYQLALNAYVSVARQLLTSFGGYECKEPEPGKFTLAFQHLNQAIGWAAQLQHELLNIKWPQALMTMADCKPIYDEEGNMIWAGLRLRIGIAYGYISSKKPLNTGRADYFGVLANTAARVCALAAPGQILVECSDPKAQPLGSDGQPLLKEYGVTCLGLRWAPVVHDTVPVYQQPSGNSPDPRQASVPCPGDRVAQQPEAEPDPAPTPTPTRTEGKTINNTDGKNMAQQPAWPYQNSGHAAGNPMNLTIMDSMCVAPPDSPRQASGLLNSTRTLGGVLDSRSTMFTPPPGHRPSSGLFSIPDTTPSNQAQRVTGDPPPTTSGNNNNPFTDGLVDTSTLIPLHESSSSAELELLSSSSCPLPGPSVIAFPKRNKLPHDSSPATPDLHVPPATVMSGGGASGGQTTADVNDASQSFGPNSAATTNTNPSRLLQLRPVPLEVRDVALLQQPSQPGTNSDVAGGSGNSFQPASTPQGHATAVNAIAGANRSEPNSPAAMVRTFSPQTDDLTQEATQEGSQDTDKLMPLRPTNQQHGLIILQQQLQQQQQLQPGGTLPLPHSTMGTFPMAGQAVPPPSPAQLHGHHTTTTIVQANTNQVNAFDDEIELRSLGWVMLKGLNVPKMIYQAQPSSLAGRHYPPFPRDVVAAPPTISQRLTVSLTGSRTNSRGGGVASWRNVLGRALRGNSGCTNSGSLGSHRAQNSQILQRDASAQHLAMGAERWSSASGTVLAQHGLAEVQGASYTSSIPAPVRKSRSTERNIWQPARALDEATLPLSHRSSMQKSLASGSVETAGLHADASSTVDTRSHASHIQQASPVLLAGPLTSEEHGVNASVPSMSSRRGGGASNLMVRALHAASSWVTRGATPGSPHHTAGSMTSTLTSRHGSSQNSEASSGSHASLPGSYDQVPGPSQPNTDRTWGRGRTENGVVSAAHTSSSGPERSSPSGTGMVIPGSVPLSPGQTFPAGTSMPSRTAGGHTPWLSRNRTPGPTRLQQSTTTLSSPLPEPLGSSTNTPSPGQSTAASGAYASSALGANVHQEAMQSMLQSTKERRRSASTRLGMLPQHIVTMQDVDKDQEVSRLTADCGLIMSGLGDLPHDQEADHDDQDVCYLPLYTGRSNIQDLKARSSTTTNRSGMAPLQLGPAGRSSLDSRTSHGTPDVGTAQADQPNAAHTAMPSAANLMQGSVHQGIHGISQRLSRVLPLQQQQLLVLDPTSTRSFVSSGAGLDVRSDMEVVSQFGGNSSQMPAERGPSSSVFTASQHHPLLPDTRDPLTEAHPTPFWPPSTTLPAGAVNGDGAGSQGGPFATAHHQAFAQGHSSMPWPAGSYMTDSNHVAMSSMVMYNPQHNNASAVMLPRGGAMTTTGPLASLEHMPAPVRLVAPSKPSATTGRFTSHSAESGFVTPHNPESAGASSANTMHSSPVPPEHQPQMSPNQQRLHPAFGGDSSSATSPTESMSRVMSAGMGTGAAGLLGIGGHSPTISAGNNTNLLSRLLRHPSKFLNKTGTSLMPTAENNIVDTLPPPTSAPAPSAASMLMRSAVKSPSTLNLMQRLLNRGDKETIAEQSVVGTPPDKVSRSFQGIISPSQSFTHSGAAACLVGTSEGSMKGNNAAAAALRLAVASSGPSTAGVFSPAGRQFSNHSQAHVQRLDSSSAVPAVLSLHHLAALQPKDSAAAAALITGAGNAGNHLDSKPNNTSTFLTSTQGSGHLLSDPPVSFLAAPRARHIHFSEAGMLAATSGELLVGDLAATPQFLANDDDKPQHAVHVGSASTNHVDTDQFPLEFPLQNPPPVTHTNPPPFEPHSMPGLYMQGLAPGHRFVSTSNLATVTSGQHAPIAAAVADAAELAAAYLAQRYTRRATAAGWETSGALPMMCDLSQQLPGLGTGRAYAQPQVSAVLPAARITEHGAAALLAAQPMLQTTTSARDNAMVSTARIHVPGQTLMTAGPSDNYTPQGIIQLDISRPGVADARISSREGSGTALTNIDNTTSLPCRLHRVEQWLQEHDVPHDLEGTPATLPDDSHTYLQPAGVPEITPEE